MGQTLIIAEKPSQAQAYTGAFPRVEKREGYFYVPPCSLVSNGANITWGYGHLVELKTPEEYKEEWVKWDLAHLPILPSLAVVHWRMLKTKIFSKR